MRQPSLWQGRRWHSVSGILRTLCVGIRSQQWNPHRCHLIASQDACLNDLARLTLSKKRCDIGNPGCQGAIERDNHIPLFQTRIVSLGVHTEPGHQNPRDPRSGFQNIDAQGSLRPWLGRNRHPRRQATPKRVGIGNGLPCPCTGPRSFLPRKNLGPILQQGIQQRPPPCSVGLANLRNGTTGVRRRILRFQGLNATLKSLEKTLPTGRGSHNAHGRCQNEPESWNLT